MTSDTELDTEFAYITWDLSCRALYSPTMCCRRRRDHDDEHAAGFGAQRVRWVA